jgi:integrase
MRRAIYERFREQHGAKQIGTLPPKFILHTLSKMKPVAARNWLKALRTLLEFAVAEDFRADNPAAGIKLAKHEAQSHHSWTDGEIARCEAHYAICTKERLAFALLLHTGQRRGDVVRMGPQHLRPGPDGPELYVEQEKTGTKLLLPIRPELQTVLDGTACQHLTYITTKTGKPYSGNDFSEAFRTWCDAAGLPGQCTAHGLRHAAGRLMAERGCTPHQIAAVLGHKSLRMAEHYSKAAEQAKLARAAARRMRPNYEPEVANLGTRLANDGKKS